MVSRTALHSRTIKKSFLISKQINMKTKIYSLFAILTLSVSAWSQGVGINETGSNPDPSAILDVNSSNKGFLPPRMTTPQRDLMTSLSPGLMIFNTDINCLEYFNGSSWISTCAGNVNGSASPDCNSRTLNGIYQVGVAMSGTNFVTIPVQVATAGSWTASTNTVNGISFSGGGVFSQPGVVTNIVLYATPGVLPNSNGNFTYTLTLGSSTCNFNVSFSSLPACAAPTPALSFATPNTNTWPLTIGTSRIFNVNGGTTNSTSFTYSVVPATGVSAPTGSVTAGATPNITFANAGNYTITFTSSNEGDGTCAPASITASSSFEVVSGPPAPSATFCDANNRIIHSNLPTAGSTHTVTIAGVPVTITRSGTISSGGANQAGSCNTPLLLGATPAFLLPSSGTSATFTFSQPVSNVQIVSAMDKANDRMNFTAFNGFADVSNQLVLSRLGTCPNSYIQPASNAVQLQANSSNNVGVSIGGVFFTSLTISFIGEDAQFALSFCNAATNACEPSSPIVITPSSSILYGAIAPGNNSISFTATGVLHLCRIPLKPHRNRGR